GGGGVVRRLQDDYAVVLAHREIERLQLGAGAPERFLSGVEPGRAVLGVRDALLGVAEQRDVHGHAYLLRGWLEPRLPSHFRASGGGGSKPEAANPSPDRRPGDLMCLRSEMQSLWSTDTDRRTGRVHADAEPLGSHGRRVQLHNAAAVVDGEQPRGHRTVRCSEKREGDGSTRERERIVHHLPGPVEQDHPPPQTTRHIEVARYIEIAVLVERETI